MDYLVWIVVAAVVLAVWAWSRRSTPEIRIPGRRPEPTKAAPPPLRRDPPRPMPAPQPVASVSFSLRSYDSSDPVNHTPEYSIEYADADGVVTERQIAILSRGWKDETFKAWCFLRSEQRTFRYDRVLSARNLRTGRSIKSLGDYVRRNW